MERPSLFQFGCLLKAVITITGVVNIVNITTMPPQLFLRRFSNDRRSSSVVKSHYCSSVRLTFFLLRLAALGRQSNKIIPLKCVVVTGFLFTKLVHFNKFKYLN